jgi:hypothetical protein
VDQFSSILSVLVHMPTGSLFVDHLDHVLFVKNTLVLLLTQYSIYTPFKERSIRLTPPRTFYPGSPLCFPDFLAPTPFRFIHHSDSQHLRVNKA